jgi:ornithine carbamoyltransferase
VTANFLTVDDLTAAELESVLDRASRYKREGAPPALDGGTLAMIFEKPSTRTRVSFETGATRLGGHAVFLGPDDIHLGHGEPIKDTARAVSRYVDVVMARLFDHADVEELGAYATVPVVNGLTDDAHPCQAVADLLTIRERFDGFDASVAWVGDGNNVCRSLVVGAAMVGLDLTVAVPPAFAVDDAVLDRAAELGTAPETTTDPAAAVDDADVVYTDVWVSMGEADERERKLAAFEDAGFRLTESLLDDQYVMHCLPAHRGEEITDAVIESDRAIVWDQAANRLHAQNGLLAHLLED